jgi:hypothetical protein
MLARCPANLQDRGCMAKRICPCGCGRTLRWSDYRLAKGSGMAVLSALPPALRITDLFEAWEEDGAPAARAFTSEGESYAAALMTIAHGDHSPAAMGLEPKLSETLAWVRRASELQKVVRTLDGRWWDWWVSFGCPHQALLVRLGPEVEAPAMPPPVRH